MGNAVYWLAALAVAAALYIAARKPWRKAAAGADAPPSLRRQAIGNGHIAVDGDAVVYMLDGFPRIEKKVSELRKLSVVTTDQGPLVDDVFLTLWFDDIVWPVPSEHPDYEQVYEALSKRLAFDYKEYIKAMSCAENNEFIVWMPAGKTGDLLEQLHQ